MTICLNAYCGIGEENLAYFDSEFDECMFQHFFRELEYQVLTSFLAALKKENLNISYWTSL